MSRINKFQTNFSLGEISPKMYGGFDLEQYGAATKTCLNFIPSHLRCLTRRPGTYFIRELEDSDKESRLIPFQYSNQQSYVLELNEGSVRFYKDQGIILQSRGIDNGNFSTNIDGWTDISSGGVLNTISYNSMDDRLSLNYGEMVGYAAAVYGPIKHSGIMNYTLTLSVYGGGVTVNIGTSSAGSQYLTQAVSTGVDQTVSFTATSNTDLYITILSVNNAEVDSISLNTPPYKINIPYSEEEIQELHYEQSFDVIFLAHPSYKPARIVRLGHDQWYFEYISFDENPYMDINRTTTTLTPSAITGSITVTSSAALFASTDVGRTIRYRAGNEAIFGDNLLQYPGTAAQIFFDVTFYPVTSAKVTVTFISGTGSRTLKSYTASSSPSAGQFTIIGNQVKTGDTASDTDIVEIRETNSGTGVWGYGTITAYTSATQVTVLVVNPLNGTNASTQWRLGAWSATTGYPATVTLFEQRLFFANTETQPNTLWGSRTASFYDYAPDNEAKKDQVDDDTSITFTLNTPAINWLKGNQALIAGCQDGIIQSSGSNGPITATSVYTKKDLSIESSTVMPVVSHNTTIHVEHLQKRIHALSYGLSSYGFQEADLSNFSDHLIENSEIKAITFSSVPNSLLWSITEAGKLLSCLFRPDKGLIGWTRHQIGGTNAKVKSLAAIPGAGYSELWVIVDRTVDGNTVKYVEVMQPDFEFQDLEEAFFVDSGISYNGSPISSFSNLDHLEGETVSVLADGAVHPDCVVTAGAITLDNTYSVVHAGLSYNSDVETLQLEGGSRVGTSQTTISRIFEVGIRLYNTVNMKVGDNFTEMNRRTFRSTADDLGEAVPLFTGDYIFKYNGTFSPEYKLAIRQDQPLPMTILAMIFKAEVNDR